MIDENMMAEFERMIDNKTLNRKLEIQADIEMLNKVLTDIEDKIAIYSTIDMVRVEQLAVTKRELELMFLDVLSESNDLWLQSIKSA